MLTPRLLALQSYRALSALCLFVLLALTGACDVYDPDLLNLGLEPGGSPSHPRQDAGRDGGNMSQGDAGSDRDGSVSEPECVVTENPDCTLRCRERCNGQDDDCDGKVDESGLKSLCNLYASTSVCVRGTCLIASCDRDRVDCNDLPEDGCEATLDSVEHCGLCRNRCELANAAASCSDGGCEVAACNGGFGDCDGQPHNGCEQPLNTLMDCAACGSPCKLPHATTDCETGSCKFDRCEAGWGDCNQDAQQTSGGDGCETDLNTPSHCGACDVECPASAPYCSGGKCSAISCPAGLADCDADNLECETDLRTTDNCGGCGASCNAVANATVSCSAQGTCEPACNLGFASCDDSLGNGCETDIRSLSNCGSCGIGCAHANATSSCDAGSCVLATCNSGYGDCNSSAEDGCEQRLNTAKDCGQCGRPCTLDHATATCNSGSCQVSSCGAGYGNCDGNASNGCETDLTTSAQNCSACGQACPTNFSCQGGRCVCDSNNDCSTGQSCCDGSCVDIRDDGANCGGCGIACGTGQTCCNGTCKDLSSDFNNCGSCGNSCGSNSNRCSNGQCRCTNDSPCSGIYQCCSNGCHTILLCR